MEVFEYLGLAAMVDNKYICMHGGLSADINSVHDMRSIDRKQEVPSQGSMCDLLWSDPQEGHYYNPRPPRIRPQF